MNPTLQNDNSNNLKNVKYDKSNITNIKYLHIQKYMINSLPLQYPLIGNGKVKPNLNLKLENLFCICILY